MKTMIKSLKLGKQYKIRHLGQPNYPSFRELITSSIKNSYKKVTDLKNFRTNNTEKELFWALRDISIEIKKGEKVGIIGKNGAGKTTFLKILSRITSPSEGYVEVRGTTASILEVGVGFHPELTGRENIFLYGAILGMKKNEIRKKFGEIVSFAEIEKFLDTPVKRYSSGMYVRLAFAVAAHLETDILIVDEVLAVGDIRFQKKCLGKMEENTKKEGRTVLFVSHNMAAVKSLCNRCILLENGRQVIDSTPDQTINEYIRRVEVSQNNTSPGEANLTSRKNPYKDLKNEGYIDDLLIKKVTLFDDKNRITSHFLSGSGVTIDVIVKGLVRFNASLRIVIKNIYGFKITTLDTNMVSNEITAKRDEIEKVSFHIPKFQLAPGKYYLDIDVYKKGIKIIDFSEAAIYFYIEENDIYNSGFEFKSSDGVIFLLNPTIKIENFS